MDTDVGETKHSQIPSQENNVNEKPAGSAVEVAVDSVDDDDIDDDDEDEDYDLIDSEIKNVEEQLASSPANYELHLKLITLLRNHGELEKLRIARENFSSLFPVTPKLWIEWTEDEIRLLSTTSNSEEISKIEALFSRGVQDYLSVKLWLSYTRFLECFDPEVGQMTPIGLSKIRRVYEEALSAAGLHLSEGHRIWDAYRLLEVALLKNMEEQDADAISKQVERVRSIFRRQLSTPHYNADSTFEEYLKWEESVGNESSAAEKLHIPFKTAQATALARNELEESIVAASSFMEPEKKLEAYLTYVEFEEASRDPARIQVLYERTVEEFPVHSQVWIKYIDFVDSSLKVPVVVRSVYSRAVRNLPWVGELWVRYLLALERIGAPEEEISQVFEKSLTSGLQFAEEYLLLFLTRADGLRRRLDSATHGAKVEDIRATFLRGSEFLELYFPDFVDRSLRLHSYWAEVECRLAKDLPAARQVWETLLKKKSDLVEVWLAYVEMEVRFGEIVCARAVFRKGYVRRMEGSGTQTFCERWVRFEREYGSLEDYDRAISKVTPILRTSQSQAVEALPAPEPKAKAVKPSKGKHEAKSDKKRKPGVGFKEPEPKKHRRESEKAGEAEEAPAMEDKGQGNEDGKEDKKEKAVVVYSDECTAFVSSLAFNVKKEELEEFFKDCEGLSEVRMVMDRKSNQFKGFAYVDFSSQSGLDSALAKNKERIHGRPVSILKSDPKRGRGGSRGGHSGQGRGSGSRDDKSDKSEGFQAMRPRAQRIRGSLQLVGKPTFAVPRSLARGKAQGGSGADGAADGEPLKTNADFRKAMLDG